jgi:hypothetical protein
MGGLGKFQDRNTAEVQMTTEGCHKQQGGHQGCQAKKLALLASLPNNKNIKTLLGKSAKSANLSPSGTLESPRRHCGFNAGVAVATPRADLAESGYSNFELNACFGFVAPAKTPSATVSQLGDWFTAAMQVSEVKSKLVSQGLFTSGSMRHRRSQAQGI